jgi:hypothetical protein
VTEPEPLPDYVLRNRAYWDEVNAARHAEPGRRAWARDDFTWGIFKVPESDLRALPDDLAGRDVIELGCGIAYLSAWLARAARGSRGSTTRKSSSRQRESSRPNTTWSSRSSMATLSLFRCRMRASTSP